MAYHLICPLQIISFYITLIYAAVSLSPQITKFIPDCARGCFQSFVDSNFNGSACGKSPSLECLCSTPTSSGYTVGDGALECLLLEDDVTYCTGNDAQESVAVNAFGMCNGIPNSLPNTRSILTATVTVVLSNVPTIPAMTTLGTSIHSSGSSTITTLKSIATSAPAVATSSSTRTSIAAPPASQTPTQTPSVHAPRSKGQIAGITAAAVGGAAIVFGLIFFLTYWRRRHRSRRDSSTLPFQADPAIGKAYDGSPGSPGGNIIRGWGNTPTSPRIPPRVDTSPLNMFSRRNTVLDNIGLAVSPERPDRSSKRTSKLLPEKPNLALAVPRQGPVEGQQQLLEQHEIPGRRSTITQFEEDDGSAATEGDRDIATNLSGSSKNILTPIDAFPTPPRDSKLLSPPQDFNNARNPVHVPEPYVLPLNLGRRGVGSFSRPRPKLQIPERQGGWQGTNSLQSVTQPLSTHSQQTYHNTHPTSHNAPSTGRGSSGFIERDRQGHARNPASWNQVAPCGRASANSFTSFDTEESSLLNEDPPMAAAFGGGRKSTIELSPVEGSPASGKSPVLYPKIPAPARLMTHTMEMVPPPPQPDFWSMQPSRSIGHTGLQAKPWRAAEIAAQRQRNMRRDELRLSRATRPSPQIGRAGLQPVRGHHPTNNEQRIQRHNPNSLLTLPSQKQSLIDPFSSQPQVYYQRRPHMAAIPSGSDFRESSRPDSALSAKSSSSSLLSKRLGADKAARLHLSTNNAMGITENGGQVLRKENVRTANTTGGWRQPLPQQVQQSGGIDAGAENSSIMRERKDAQLTSKSMDFGVDTESDAAINPPVTPGWVPTLTPTRKGDELFLSVQ